MKDELYTGNHINGEIEIISSEVLLKNEFITVSNDNVVFPGGNKGTYLRVGTESNKSVAVLPVTESGKIVFIKSFRHGARGWGIEIPKGAVEPDEDEISAVRRELLEETGYSFETAELIGEFNCSPDISQGAIKCYIAKNCKKTNEPKPEKTEAIGEISEYSREEYHKAVKEMDFADALTELMLFKADEENRNG